MKRINANKRNTFSLFKIKNITPKKTTRKYGILWQMHSSQGGTLAKVSTMQAKIIINALNKDI